MQQISPKEEEKERTNVVDFSVITGGKGPPNDNWLSELDVGTYFLFRPKQKKYPEDVGVQRAVVVYHWPTATLLFDNLNQELYFTVETYPFSNTHRLVQIIENEKAPTQKEEDNNVPAAAE